MYSEWPQWRFDSFDSDRRVAAAIRTATEAGAARQAAPVDRLQEAAAYEVRALAHLLAALAENAADTAPDADARDAESDAALTFESATLVSDLVDRQFGLIDDARAQSIADAVAELCERAIQTGYSADRCRDIIPPVARSARVAAGLLASDAKIRLFETDGNLPQQLVQVVRGVSAELLAYLKADAHALHKLRPRQFEELVAEILAGFGWEVELTPTTRDGGYDIFAISRDTAAGVRTSWLVECKRYAPRRKVGVDIVRSLYGLKLDLRVANAMVATTSHFAGDALKYKRSRYDLELKDYESIVEWINEYKLNPSGKLCIRDNHLVPLR